MNIKNLFKLLSILLIVAMSISQKSFAQACPGNQIEVVLQNFTSTSTEIEYDIYLRNSGSTSMKLAAFTCSFIYPTGMLPSGATGTYTCLQQPSVCDFPTLNNITPSHNLATRQLRWSNSPINLTTGNPLEISTCSYMKFARVKFASTVPWTSNFQGSLTAVNNNPSQTGLSNLQVVVYCNGNTNSTVLQATTPGTLLAPPTTNFVLNSTTSPCPTQMTVQNIVVPCTGSNGSAQFTMNPAPQNVGGMYSVDGGTPQSFIANPISISGLSAGAHSFMFYNFGCDTVRAYLGLCAIGTSQNVTACNSYTWSSNSVTYNVSGTYLDTVINSSGCQVVNTLNLTINTGVVVTSSDTACGTYTWNANGQAYTSSGTYSFVDASCNQQVLNLTIDPILNVSQTDTSCGPYVWAVNGQTYTTGGSHTYSSGCSNYLLNLLMNGALNTSITTSWNALTSGQVSGTHQWVKCPNYSIIPGATSQVYNPPSSGDYAVIVSANGCTDTSGCQTFNVNGVSDVNKQHLLQLYPNPSNGEFTLSSDKLLFDATIKVLSTTGQVINVQEKLSGKVFNFDISKVANGIYFLEILNQGEIYRVKVVKE